ncbi:hypoxanthine phosphoribosyltransferase, partial [Patescibacteria group bacterium]|nr:hypoxanthine phosphoribosyltransferase [Patescibacteria group bacterium]
MNLMEDIKSTPLLKESQIKERVEEMAGIISSDYPNGLIVIGVLKGAFIFMSDLVRALQVPVHCDFVKVASYKGKESSGKVSLELAPNLSGLKKRILLVEDIVDTGLTLSWLKDYFSQNAAVEVKVCCLLDKPSRRKVDISPDYTGF